MTSTPSKATAGHTPGPWERKSLCVFATKYGNLVMAADGDFGGNGISYEEAVANASLIAAAPDLLRVAELLVDWLDEEPGAHKLCDTARAAISRATGEA